MYNYNKSQKFTERKISNIVEYFGLIIVIVVIVVITKNVKKKVNTKNVTNVNNGKYDAELAKLENYYSILRQNINGLGAGVLSIGAYLFVLDGRVDSSSSWCKKCNQYSTCQAIRNGGF